MTLDPKTLRRLCEVVLSADGYEAAVEDGAVVLAGALECGCLIALLADDEQTLYPIGLYPAGDGHAAAFESLGQSPYSAGEGYLGEALRSGEPIIETIDEALLVVPLIGRTGRVGVVACNRLAGERQFDGGDIELVLLAAPIIALAVEAALLSEALTLAAGRRAVRPRMQAPNERPAVDRRKSSGLAALSERERDILERLAQGFASKEVADQVGLSVRTIEWHRSRMQWKLGVASSTELLEAARAHGLGDRPDYTPAPP